MFDIMLDRIRKLQGEQVPPRGDAIIMAPPQPMPEAQILKTDNGAGLAHCSKRQGNLPSLGSKGQTHVLTAWIRKPEGRYAAVTASDLAP